MLLLLSAALAASVAVLPLDQGAGGAAYEGLGTALAGMITSDLSSAPGLTLVERSRLDALTAELELGKGAFVDPATAQKLGKGLGAEYVVLGSYSIVGETFVLDARMVSVASGTVARAHAANGTVAAFVDVEKALVSGLLDGLDVKLAEDARLKLLAAAPTRNFDAFAAYSEGVSAEKAGRVADARAAYAEALGADPSFREASTALGTLRLQLDGAASDRHRREKKARADLLDKVVATFPEPTNGKDKKQQAGFLLRLLALQEQGRDCQRYAEMQRYLDTTGWKFSMENDEYKRLWTEATKLAVGVGYAPDPEVDPQGHREVEFRIQADGAGLFSSVGRFFYSFSSSLLKVERSPDLTATMARCITAPEQVTELGKLALAVKNAKIGDQLVFGYPVPLVERLEWSAMAVRARTTGVDAAMSARVAELVAHYDDTTPTKALGGSTARAWVESEARQIAADGLLVARAKAQKFGMRDADLVAIVDAVASGDPARVAVEDPDCKTLLTYQKGWATAMKGKPLYRGAAALLAPIRDLGCLVGQPARFATPREAYHWVETAPSRANPENAGDCVKAFEELPGQLHPSYEVPLDGPRAHQLLGWYYSNLVGRLCVND